MGGGHLECILFAPTSCTLVPSIHPSLPSCVTWLVAGDVTFSRTFAGCQFEYIEKEFFCCKLGSSATVACECNSIKALAANQPLVDISSQNWSMARLRLFFALALAFVWFPVY